MTTRFRVGVIGAGPMGRLHARAVSRVAAVDQNCVLTAVIDRHHSRAVEVAEEFQSTAIKDLDGALPEVDGFIVCVPTSSHGAVASYLLQRGYDVLVEKPLAESVAEGKRLAALAEKHRCILQVGHVEWYNQAWREAVRLAGMPLREINVERRNPPNNRGADIDVVQDFMLHDLDWITRLLKDDVVEVKAEGRCVLSDKLDEAEARLQFRSGCQVTLRASRVAKERHRKVRVVGCDGVVTADLLTREIDGERVLRAIESDPLEMQWRDFMKSVRTRAQPEVDASVGVAALQWVDRIRDAIDQGSRSLNDEDDSALGR